MESSLLLSLAEPGSSPTTEPRTYLLRNCYVAAYACEIHVFFIAGESPVLVDQITFAPITNISWSLPTAENYRGPITRVAGTHPSTALAEQCPIACQTVLAEMPGAAQLSLEANVVRQESETPHEEATTLPPLGKCRLGIALQKLPTPATSFMSRLEVDSWGIRSHTRTKHLFRRESFGRSYCLFAGLEALLLTRLQGQEQHWRLLKNLGESVSGVIFV